MLIHKYVCDRCGGEIKNTYDECVELRIKFWPRGDAGGTERELCEKCSDEFLKFINNIG